MKLFRLPLAFALSLVIFSSCQDDIPEVEALDNPPLETSIEGYIKNLKNSGESELLPKITDFMLSQNFTITEDAVAISNYRDNILADADSECVKERSFIDENGYTYHFTEYSEGCPYYSGCITVYIFSVNCNGLCSFNLYC